MSLGNSISTRMLPWSCCVIALERRFNTRFAALMHERITGPLGMNSTALPLPRDLLGRAVQGYGPRVSPIGQPG